MGYHRFLSEDGANEYGSFRVFETQITDLECRCGNYEVPGPLGISDSPDCPSCGKTPISYTNTDKRKFWWWACFPGCMPDGEPMGPFDSYDEALKDARSDG